MKYLIVIIMTLSSLVTYSQNEYGLKQVTIYQEDDCSEKMKECLNQLCWLTWKNDSGGYTQGVGIGYGGCHHLWIREVREYDSNGKLVEQLIDSSICKSFIIKSPYKKVVDYCNSNGSYIIYNYKSKNTNDIEKEPYFIYFDSIKLE